MGDTIHWVDFDLLEKFMTEVFVRVGLPRKDAGTCAEVLITSDKRGIDSHGVGRFKPIYIDRIRAGQVLPVTEIELVRETRGTAVLDGHNGMGQVVSRRAMEMAIDKARECGIGMTVVRNSNHYGIAGYYALMAVEANMIGITGTNARPSIAPTFGVENMLGTNPLTFGMPTDEEFPFVLDCATSVSQRGKIEAYARLGKPIPPGWVIGRDGSARTDTEQILKDLVKGQAALVPVGGMGEETAGYKGYGYAAVVEILSAALQGGPFLRALTGLDGEGKRIPYRLGHFFIAIDVSAFIDIDEFRSITGRILRDLRGSEKMPGQERIYTAGEKEHLAWLERKNKGAKVDVRLQEQLLSLKKDYGLDEFTFPFE
jgi:L-2-hydroxycarboxylate dehydrogenase (NAD+)